MSVLQLGDQGPGVRAWQRIVGVNYRNVDGVFGPKTDGAVKAWQAMHAVEPDGVIGPLTRAAVPFGALIKPYEGLRLATYDDHDGQTVQRVGQVWRRIGDGALIIGHPTIGWGRRLWPGEWITTCTRAEADDWLERRLAGTELPAVNRLVVGDATRRAAAASCAYNAGTGWLSQLAAAGFTEAKWMSRNKNSRGIVEPGLTMRRAEEWALWAGQS